MILILGLIILIAALIVAVAGVMANLGSAHELTNDFSVSGYHVTSSAGALFLYGIAIGALALLGLALMLAGARRAARRDDSIASKRESAVVDREREDLIQRASPRRPPRRRPVKTRQRIVAPLVDEPTSTRRALRCAVGSARG
ncbi:hypothetical protein [Streptomyces goshikiensis]|uniref:hypothetical protein n=1 Tax=Streptomyces goshikiensis TaxID=1942 RepID=UPI0033E3DCAA